MYTYIYKYMYIYIYIPSLEDFSSSPPVEELVVAADSKLASLSLSSKVTSVSSFAPHRAYATAQVFREQYHNSGRSETFIIPRIDYIYVYIYIYTSV
jgi:hypothetical protein